MLGLGTSYNTSSHWRTDVPTTKFTRAYYDNTQSSFSYAIGTGIDFALDKHFRLGIGYRFTDFGQSTLGQGRINAISVTGALSQNHLYANELLGQVTYIL